MINGKPARKRRKEGDHGKSEKFVPSRLVGKEKVEKSSAMMRTKQIPEHIGTITRPVRKNNAVTGKQLAKAATVAAGPLTPKG